MISQKKIKLILIILCLLVGITLGIKFIPKFYYLHMWKSSLSKASLHVLNSENYPLSKKEFTQLNSKFLYYKQKLLDSGYLVEFQYPLKSIEALAVFELSSGRLFETQNYKKYGFGEGLITVKSDYLSIISQPKYIRSLLEDASKFESLNIERVTDAQKLATLWSLASADDSGLNLVELEQIFECALADKILTNDEVKILNFIDKNTNTIGTTDISNKIKRFISDNHSNHFE